MSFYIFKRVGKGQEQSVLAMVFLTVLRLFHVVYVIDYYRMGKNMYDLHYPTVFNSQYAPNDWSTQLGSDPNCYGKLDGIRRRLTNGYTIEIVKL